MKFFVYVIWTSDFRFRFDIIHDVNIIFGYLSNIIEWK